MTYLIRFMLNSFNKILMFILRDKTRPNQISPNRSGPNYYKIDHAEPLSVGIIEDRFNH